MHIASNLGRWSSVLILASVLATGCSGGVAPEGDAGHDGSAGTDGGPHGDGSMGGDMSVLPDGGGVDGGGVDGGGDVDAGPGVCGNGVLEGTEQCDDGNTNDNDACRNDCTNQCGDGMVNAAASETCDTAIASGTGSCPTSCDDSMACTQDLFTGSACTTACSHVAITMPAAGDGCCPPGATPGTDSDCAAGCGNGFVDSGETCDTAITSGAGACPTTCDDGVACTTDAMTGSACTAACTHTAITTPVAGDGCCPAGATHSTDADCPVTCGNGMVESGETCDTGIASGTGSCPTAASCNDGMACTTDMLVGGGTCTAACSHTTITTPMSGDMCCPSGANHNTDTDCAPVCGNGVVEGPGETCEPPSTSTCDAMCHTTTTTTPPTAYRVSALRLISPRVTVNVFGCADITDGTTIGLSMSLNQSLMAEVATADSTGHYPLNIMNVFRPLDRTMMTNATDVDLNAVCTSASPSVCNVAATMPMDISTMSMQMASGSCYTPVATDVNASCPAGGGSCTSTYSPTANTVAGPCYITNEADIMVTFSVSGSALSIPLHHAQMAGTWIGAASPPARAMPAIIVGFISETEAAAVTLPASLPLVGGDPLTKHLQRGQPPAGMTGSYGCNVGGGRWEDDRDTVGGVRGFWFFLNATLDLTTWSGP